MSAGFDVLVLYAKIYTAEIINVYGVFIIIHEHAFELVVIMKIELVVIMKIKLVVIMKIKTITVFVCTCFKPFSTKFQLHVCSECGH